jgi:hypothetical protein
VENPKPTFGASKLQSIEAATMKTNKSYPHVNCVIPTLYPHEKKKILKAKNHKHQEGGKGI